MMRAFALNEILPVIDGQLQGESCDFQGVSIDTRTLTAGDLYVAISGDRFDGHQFAEDAVAKGAVAIVADRPLNVSVPVLIVPDTREALGKIAAYNRQQFTGSVTAITGSCGKTTTKEMLAAVLSQDGETLFTQGNLNNDIGAPLTLLRLSGSVRHSVIELGASGVGEIAWTTSLTAPEVAIITNASEAHLEGFGSRENIVIAKGEIIDGVSATGTVILNQDDPAFPLWRKRAGDRRVIAVSAAGQPDADYSAADVTPTEKGMTFMLKRAGGGSVSVALPLMGQHNIANALLVVAAAEAQGIRESQWLAGLSGIEAAPGRLRLLQLTPDLQVLDDSYNANPASMEAALDALATRTGTTIAVLGDMAELGDTAADLHQGVAAHGRSLGIDHLLVIGEYAEDYRTGSQGMAEILPSHEAITERLLALTQGPATVLVKGSRSAGMDRVITILNKRITG